MLMAPADWPKTVTRSGSPPKDEMLSRTHSRAAIWSEQAEVGLCGVIGAEVEETLGAQTVVEGDQDDAVTGERGAVVAGDAAGAVAEGAPMEPHHDGQASGRVRCPDVEVEEVLAGDVDLGDEAVHRRGVRGLGCGRAVRTGVTDPVPRRGGRGGAKRSGPAGAAA